MGAQGAHADTSVIQERDGLGGGVSGEMAPFGRATGARGETAVDSVNAGISTDAPASLGCDETMKPGAGESPQSQAITATADFSAAARFF